MEYPKGRKSQIIKKAKKQGCSDYEIDKRTLSSWCSFAKAELRRKATPSEKVLMEKLLDAGFIFHDFQKSFYKGKLLYIADFFIRKPHKVVIEVDGGYHFTEYAKRKDLLKDRFYLSNKQVKSVLRMSNQQAYTITLSELTTIINNLKEGEVSCLYER